MSTKAIQNTIIFIISLTLLVPFLVFDNLYFPYIVGKAVIFRSLVLIAFILWGILVFKDKSFLPSKNGVLISFFILLCVYFVSAIVGESFRDSIFSNFERMMGWGTTLFLLLFFIISSSVLREKKSWNKIFITQIVVSMALFLMGLKELIESGINFRIDASLGNPIYLSVIFLFSIFFAGYLLFEKYSRKMNIFLIFTIILNSTGLFFTGTRGAMVGLFIGVLFVLVSILIKYWNLKKVKIFGIIASLILIVVPITLFSLKDTSFVKNNHTLNRITQISIEEGTGYARFVNWGIAWQGIKERPVLGWGQENYMYVYDKYYDPRMYGQEPFFDSSHNTLLDVWINGGLLALLSYLSIFIFALIYLFKKNNIVLSQKIILSGLFLSYFTQNIFVFDNITSFILFVLLISFAVCEKENYSCKFISSKISLSIIIIISAFLFLFFVFYPWRSNLYLRDAMNVFKKDVSGNTVFYYEEGLLKNKEIFGKALKNNYTGIWQIKNNAGALINYLYNIETNSKKINKDIDEYKMFIKEILFEESENYPDAANVNYNTSITFLKMGDLESARTYIEKAVEISPNRQIYLELLATIQKAFGDIDYLNTLEKIYRLEETNDKAWLNYLIAVSEEDEQKFSELLIDKSNLNRVEAVKEFLNIAINKRPDLPQAYLNKVVVLARLGLFEDSLESLSVVEEKFPKISSQTKIWRESLEKGELPQ